MGPGGGGFTNEGEVVDLSPPKDGFYFLIFIFYFYSLFICLLIAYSPFFFFFFFPLLFPLGPVKKLALKKKPLPKEKLVVFNFLFFLFFPYYYS